MSESDSVHQSLQNCTPCQENALLIAGISLCRISKELQSKIDCDDITKKVSEGNLSKKDAIELIIDSAKETNVADKAERVVQLLTNA